MHKGTIVVKHKDHVLPEPLIKKMLAAHKTGVSLAILDPGTQDPILLHSSSEETSLEFIQKTQESFKETDMVFLFKDYPAGADEDDKQPYVLAGEDESPELIAFIEGDYSNHTLAGSNRADAHFAIENVVFPRVAQLYELVGEDIPKLMEQLDKELVKKEFASAGVSRSTIVLVANTGQICTFSKNTEGGSFPWGWCSNLMGYKEGEYPDASQVVEPKLKSKLKAKLASVVSSSAPASAPEPEKPVVQPVVEPGTVIHNPTKPAVEPATATPPKEQLSTTTTVASAGLKTQQPPVAHPDGRRLTNKETKAWYNKYFGSVPEGYKRRPAVPVKILDTSQLADPGTRVVKDFRELGHAVAEIAPVVPAKASVPAVKSDTTNHNIGSGTAPLIPTKQREYVLKDFLSSAELKKLREAGLAPVPTAEEIADYEKKMPSFSEQLGNQLQLHDTLRWGFETRLKLCTSAAHTAAVLLQFYALELSKAWQGREFGVKSTEENPVVTTTTGTKRLPLKKKVA